MRFGAFANTYEEYYGVPADIINNYTPSLSFHNIKNEIKPTKNKELLNKIASEQHKLYKFKSSKSNKKNFNKIKKTKKIKHI